MWWPGLFIGEALFYSWISWLVVIAGVALELFALHREKVSSPKRILVACLTGNICSFVFGTILGVFVMLPWHFLADRFFEATFNPINWAATLIIMLGLSISLEALVVRIILKAPLQRFLSIIAMGNLLVYAYLVLMGVTETTIVFGELPPSMAY